ncbi:MAG: DUF1294 domain-containing protein [Roseburia sp.]|nr:DUF1294 domain-containing protein [Roseburia sp.]
MLLYRFTEDWNVDSLLTITSIIGGATGALLAIILLDRKSVKDNMMSRVFVVCVCIIQIVLYLFFKGGHGEQITFAFWEFFGKYKILIIYLVIINFVSFAVYAIDKIRALEGAWRIRVVTLLGLAFMGGSLGAILAMYILRHKTTIDYFTVGVPLIMLMQVVVVFYLMNIA